MISPEALGTDTVRWDLSQLYRGIDDPSLAADVDTAERIAKAFRQVFKGKLKTKLGDALGAYAAYRMSVSKPMEYVGLLHTVSLDNAAVSAKKEELGERLSRVSGDYTAFFEIEVARLSAKDVERQKNHPAVARHMPFIQDARRLRRHFLKTDVEEALEKRAATGANRYWSARMDEEVSELRFPFRGEQKTEGEMFHLLSTEKDADTRAEVLRTINDTYKQTRFDHFSAYVLNAIVSDKRTEDRERGFESPMAERNLHNKVTSKMVDALHEAVRSHAVPLAKRYYKLKALLLGIPRLRWSDRNAPLPFADDTAIPYAEGLAIVTSSFRSFSPTLADIIEKRIVPKRWIDAPHHPAKLSGAFNSSTVLVGNVAVSRTLVNYLGSARDVMTLAHELGHAVHGILAGEAQGPLMMHAPMAYAETASTFGEMTVFEAMRARTAGSPREKRLALVAGKIDDILNTVVRQISFSVFEQKTHGAGKYLSRDALSRFWMETTEEFYGKDGEAFLHQDMDALWSYITHFHSPFYVYAYAFGDLLTASLFARRQEYGERFEPLYLDMLRAGGTKNVRELFAPFGLNPEHPDFWKQGIEAGLGALVKEAEQLAKELGFG